MRGTPRPLCGIGLEGTPLYFCLSTTKIAFSFDETLFRERANARSTGPQCSQYDDDAIADEHWPEELLAAYDNDRVLGVGGHIEPLWRNPCPWWFPSEFNWIIGCIYRGMRVRNGQIRNMIGANMSVRADVLHGCGGFAGQLGRIGGGKGSANTCGNTEFLHPRRASLMVGLDTSAKRGLSTWSRRDVAT